MEPTISVKQLALSQVCRLQPSGSNIARCNRDRVDSLETWTTNVLRDGITNCTRRCCLNKRSSTPPVEELSILPGENRHISLRRQSVSMEPFRTNVEEWEGGRRETALEYVSSSFYRPMGPGTWVCHRFNPKLSRGDVWLLSNVDVYLDATTLPATIKRYTAPFAIASPRCSTTFDDVWRCLTLFDDLGKNIKKRTSTWSLQRGTRLANGRWDSYSTWRKSVDSTRLPPGAERSRSKGLPVAERALS